jgi:CysZ protein
VVTGSIRGFFYPFRGLKFLFRHRSLLWYVAIPFGLNTILFGVFAWLVTSHLGGWIRKILPSGDAWYWAILFYVVVVLSVILLLLVVIYTLTMVGNIVLGPFNDMLSEKVELLYTGSSLDEPFKVTVLLADILRSLKVGIGKLLLYVGGLLALLALNLLPVIGSGLYGVLAGVYTLFFLGWEYVDYSMERWKFRFRLKVKNSFRNASAFVGFGAAASLMLFIPVINLAAIPLCVIGATLLFCDLRKQDKLLS